MLKNYSFLAMFMFGLLFGCAYGPQLSPMQIREITTQLIHGGYEDTYRASLTILQDQGYIIKNTDMDAGLIVAQVDRSTDFGSQFAQALFIGYVADKGTVIEVSCMINKLNDINTEVRLNIQEASYGQSSLYSGTSKQNVKQIYDPEIFNTIFNEIEREVQRRRALSSMSTKASNTLNNSTSVSQFSSQNLSEIDALLDMASYQYFDIKKVIKEYCLINNSRNIQLNVGQNFEIVRLDDSGNYSVVGKAVIAQIKGEKVALKVVEGILQPEFKVRVNSQ